MRRPFPRTATTAYARNTGLHSMSEPRRLKSQQIWSSALSTIDAHPASPSAAATRRSFDAALSPDSSRGCGTTGWFLTRGRRTPHARSTRFCGTSSSGARPFSRHSASYDSETSVGSTPTGPPSAAACAATHSSRSGTPGSCDFISVHSVPFSCSAAWTKYRPSVHSSAASAVTSAVPAEPVKPVSHERRLSASSTYSDECASVDGTRYAPSPCAFSSERKPESFIVGSAGWNSLHSGTPGRKQHGQLSSSGGRPRFLPKEILCISATARGGTREASSSRRLRGACCEPAIARRNPWKSAGLRALPRSTPTQTSHPIGVEIRGNPWKSHG